MRLHLVVGYKRTAREGEPTLIYCGPDAEAAKTAQMRAVESGRCGMVDRFTPSAPVTKYADPARDQKIQAAKQEQARQEQEAAKAKGKGKK